MFLCLCCLQSNIPENKVTLKSWAITGAKCFRSEFVVHAYHALLQIFIYLTLTPCFARRVVGLHPGSMIGDKQLTWTVKCWLLILFMLIVDLPWINDQSSPLPLGSTKCESGVDWQNCWFVNRWSPSPHASTGSTQKIALGKWSRFLAPCLTLYSLIYWQCKKYMNEN